MLLVDSSAWVEVFRGTSKGQKVITILKTNQPLYVCKISVAELVAWAEKNSLEPKKILGELEMTATYTELSYEIHFQSGLNYAKLRKIKEKISLNDAIIYTSASIHGLKLLTCDGDFEGLPDAQVVK